MANKYWFSNHPSGRVLAGSATVDFGSIADGNEEATDITVTGAALGDIVMVSHSLDVQDLQLTADVSAANTVSVVASSSGDTVDMGSGTVRVLVIPSAAVDSIIAGM